MRHSSERGMTLMELLVAMVIGSLVITLVVRGLGLSLNLYDRVAAATSSMDVRFRESLWWSDSIASLVPCTDVSRCVVGSPTSFKGYTFAPIMSEPGKRTHISWRLVPVADGIQLRYEEGRGKGVEEVAMAQQLPSDARFDYLHPDGSWRTEWNRNSDNLRLPDALRIEDGSGTVWAYGAPEQRPYGREDYRDMLGL